ncbi:hypothetical protein AFL94_15720 [Arthrobacter sp. LS16]|nr:hypothetical protein AFL94_15720 [Arthrobacter sp. LS16]
MLKAFKGYDSGEPCRVIDQQALAFSQDRIVGGIPADTEDFGNPRDGLVWANQTGQCPVQSSLTDFLTFCYGLGQVFTPHSLAVATAIASVFDDQDGGLPAEGLVGKPAGDRIAGNVHCSAGVASGVRGGGLAEHLGFRCAQVLPDSGQAQLAQAGDSDEDWCAGSTLGHRRSLSQVVSVVTSILRQGLDFLAH